MGRVGKKYGPAWGTPGVHIQLGFHAMLPQYPLVDQAIIPQWVLAADLDVGWEPGVSSLLVGRREVGRGNVRIVRAENKVH